MKLEKAYQAKRYEDGIYKAWETSGLFTAKISRGKKPFMIAMPPPNATGTLHLGHATMLAIEDAMARYRRMKGDSTLWLPGTDHAAIATQNKVEKELAQEGLTRHELGREKFIKRVHAFIRTSQNTIRKQIRKMGSSCDWKRERYTFDLGLSEAVQEIFIRMYEDGLIYRGNRIVNWCIRCASTLADDEVEYVERKEPFYYIKYGPFILGTARLETKFGDTAVAVHPDDERYQQHIGKQFTIQGVNGPFDIKVIADKVVDKNFGTGAMKVTPAHDFADFELAKRHGLEVIPVIGPDGKLLERAGRFAGFEAQEARQKIFEEMKRIGLIEKVDENYIHNLAICYRCDTPIEPLISKQWFVSVDKKIPLRASFHGKKLKIARERKEATLKEIALSVVRSGEIEILPERFRKIYFHWMENLRDWCISRQIWFGHRIPVWYCEGDVKQGGACKIECIKPVVQKEKPKRCEFCGSKNFRQDPDTLDTWFSSGLWTFSTLGWPKKTKDLQYFHPTSVLETGYDILFFWIARMILMTTYALQEVPFRTVYLHGLVRTRTGEKMSKSKPETCIDPLDMIQKYGADALRLSMLIGSSPGNDLRLYEEKIAGYRNFVNKIWNSARFALLNIPKKMPKNNLKKNLASLSLADKWILTKTQKLITEVTDDYDHHRLGEVGTKIYDFTWREYCDWYLEIAKGGKQSMAVLVSVLETILKLLHPLIPYVSEVLWGKLHNVSRSAGQVSLALARPGSANAPPKDLLMASPFPKPEKRLVFAREAASMEHILETISAIRKLRHENSVDPVRKIHAIVFLPKSLAPLFEEKRESLMRLARLEALDLETERSSMPLEKVPESVSEFLRDGIEIYLPIRNLIDAESERKKLFKEIEELGRYLAGLETKLKNEHFRTKAPQTVVAAEEEKLHQSRERLKKLEEKMSILKGKS